MKKKINNKKTTSKKTMKKSSIKKSNLLKWMQKNQILCILGLVNLLCLIIGTYIIGFLLSFAFIFIIDIITYYILKRKKRKKHSIGKIILLIIFSFGILIILAITIFFFWIAKNAPNFNPEELYQNESTIIYNNKGEIEAKLGVEKREKITYDELPEVLINAIVATEDSRFFQHNGFDLPRFIKATFGQLAGNAGAGGASTLTMQLSKNIFTSTKDEGIQGIIRKFTDIYMSIFKIEKNYTKEEILEFYVNYNYLGAASRGGAYGVEQACLTYFGKKAKDINLAEASLIAGLFNSPNALDPLKNPEKAAKRRSIVLHLMKIHGYITEEEKEIAEAISVENLITKDYKVEANHGFIDTVVAEVMKKTKKDPYTVPMEIYTTMDSEKQKHVNAVMLGKYYKWDNSKVQAGVIVIDNKTGAVVAVGANRDSGKEKIFNYATDIKKQIGSTAKPLYDYGPAIEYNNWSTYQLFADEPYYYTGGQAINNWDGTFQGLITMRTAIIGSRNIPALKTFKNIANNNIKEFVTKLGLSPELENGKIHEAHAIGGYTGESPLTVAAAYAAFANKGIYNEPYSFTKLVYRETGEVFENKTARTKVMNEDTAYMITSMLLDTGNTAIGTYYANMNNAKVAIKTGTTNYPKETFDIYKNLSKSAVNDLWVAGYDQDYAMAIWYGYDKINEEYIKNGYYTDLYTYRVAHGRLFHDLGVGIFFNKNNFPKPNNVIQVAVEKDSNPVKLPSEFTPKDMIINELFKSGTEPTEISNRYSKLDKVKNLTSKIDKNKIILSWDKVKNPDAIDENKLKTYVNSLFSNNYSQTNYLNTRLKYNKDYIGTISYNVYYKNDLGELELIKNTTEPTITYDIKTNLKSIVFVVKTTYSIFKNNMSDGEELTIDLKGLAPIVTSIINGKNLIELKVNDIYIEEKTPVIVTESGIDVTSLSTITKEIKNSKNEIVSNITTDKEDIFTITYSITYDTYKEKLVKTIKINSGL
ncbi:MAG: transglycosylase domain-containing protein [Bacilli bacterium]